MSDLVGAALPQSILARDDQRHGDEFFFDNEDEFQPAILYSFDWNAIAEAMGYQSPWWPYPGVLLGSSGFDGDNLLAKDGRFADIWRSFGSNGRLAFIGVTRDALGAPLGGVTVRCFRTASGELVDAATSDANGNYRCTSPYFDSHFLTGHKATSPAVASATVDTITPS